MVNVVIGGMYRLRRRPLDNHTAYLTPDWFDEGVCCRVVGHGGLRTTADGSYAEHTWYVHNCTYGSGYAERHTWVWVFESMLVPEEGPW